MNSTKDYTIRERKKKKDRGRVKAREKSEERAKLQHVLRLYPGQRLLFVQRVLGC